jgi:hypothetical protein
MCEVKTRGHRIKAQGKITNGSRLKGQGSIASGLRLEVRGQKSRVRSEVRGWRLEAN